MMIKSSLCLAMLFVLFNGTANAVVDTIYDPLVFQEDFIPPGADAPLSCIGWHANVGATAVVQDNNMVGSVGPILSVGDYIFTRPDVSGNPWLAWTDNLSVGAIGSISSVTNIRVTLRNGSATEDLKIALKINDTWYVSQTVLNSPNEAEFFTMGIAVQSVGWNSLTFISGSTLFEGNTMSLPLFGNVQAVGFFDANTTATKAVQIDSYIVETLGVPPILISSEAPAGSLGLLEVGTQLFSDRAYMMVECPEELKGKSFLRTSITGTRFQCIRPGVLTVLTPNPNDSADSVALTLLEQGYALTPQPSFQLILTGAANAVEVYQKTLSQGEWTDIPKWGVVVGMGEITSEPPLYMNPPQVITNPLPEYASSSRRFQGIPSMAVAPGGRLWAVWYGGAGPTEDQFNYVVGATSADGGLTWSDEKFAIDPDGDGPVRAFDPQIWIDPNGKMWVFWMQAIGHDGQIAGVWAITTDQPDVENPVWSAPVRLTDGIMMGKPIVLSSGEWVLPASTWYTDNSSRMVVSLDQGSTWQLRGAANIPAADRNADEHMIVERMDGSLWMWIRTLYGIGESVSTNRGETWSPVVPSDVKHTVARFFIHRLASGNLLLVKHGGIQEVIGRSHLTAFISADDGVTWSGGLLLDERNGISYPDGMQESNGTIYITYDWSRTVEKEILMARFSEEDILAGELVHTNSQLRLLVNKAIGAPFVFQEGFSNPDSDAPLSSIDWHANVGATAVVQDTNTGVSVGPILSVSDYIFTRPSISGNPWLAWTDNASVDAIGFISFVTKIRVTLRNGSATEDLKIALKVNDAWYVSQTVLNSPDEIEIFTVGVDVQSVGWNSLDFVSGSSLVEGGVATLPTSGAVQAVGVFDVSTTATKAVRIDNYTVETVP